ncbi:hypothetical protein B0O80DRAFT_499331 [Mortierella sp. GBAus27b]|nr:hypothetical protein BGX31_002784 [Mortierella sp. GBA43]KAI8352623.1 hypothetical protein B0O80DRAFT_499331 [Mortierella sp. GBAus27b]
MNDHDMDETLDFNTLSLAEPEERLQRAFEHSLHLSPNQEDLQQESTLSQLDRLLTETERPIGTLEQLDSSLPDAGETTTPDNGPWAKLPSPSEIHPYQPGITAEILDAMAMDPNHVFKSAPTPSPFTVPPSSSDIPEQSSSAVRKDKDDGDATRDEAKDEIPAWMLEDPKLTLQIGWDVTDTSGPNFTSKDFTLDWASSGDLSTTIDPTIMFGFSSYPTYESLSISNVIAEEHYRRSAGITPSYDDPSSPTSDSGFAKYGQMTSGEGAGALFFGYKPVANETAAMDLGALRDNQDPKSTPASSSFSAEKQKQKQWQTWRTSPGHVEDLDLDLDLDPSEPESPKIKATPGFAPALYGHE